ncbi:uncharacterized protein [Cherax quadricarinatus]|uniref:uncharacterized protein n=1 Tax=Cherax quadricarinatus TaxID=27406 RepID=UPI00387ED64B
MASECESCAFSFYDIISNFSGENQCAVQLFLQHGVVVSASDCPSCRKPTKIYVNRKIFRTLLEKCHMTPSQNLLFINEFLRKDFTRCAIKENMNITSRNIVDWKNFCDLVCLHWMNEQEAIGGIGSIIEISESKFGKKKYSRGCVMDGIWVFGGIDRDTKKHFIVPLDSKESATLIPLCQKYIKPGSTIHSDSWEAYSELNDLGYNHQTVNHSRDFVTPDVGIHTNTISKLWKNIQCWVLRAGNKKTHYKKYFARFLFTYVHSDHRTILHHFLRAIARAFPPCTVSTTVE